MSWEQTIKRIRDNATEPKLPYWFSSEKNVDCCESFCFECATALVNSGKAKHENLCGGEPTEEERCLHCAGCDHVLFYSLTDLGLEQELAHFEEFKLDLESSETCAHLLAVIEAGGEEPLKAKFGGEG